VIVRADSDGEATETSRAVGLLSGLRVLSGLCGLSTTNSSEDINVTGSTALLKATQPPGNVLVRVCSAHVASALEGQLSCRPDSEAGPRSCQLRLPVMAGHQSTPAGGAIIMMHRDQSDLPETLAVASRLTDRSWAPPAETMT
jgi:hypothetical protein